MSVRILVGDCRARLRDLPDASVHCVVTSPPYFGLRDYGCEGQMGLEPTPDEFVAGMVEVFREVRRVLRDDGTLWLNIGDSYSGGGFGGHADNKAASGVAGIAVVRGFKAKDLIGIPWMVAFALRADGWFLRQDIIWAKPNPMPESVEDRCTKSHEYLFLLTKSPRYFYDAAAIAEEAVRGFAGSTFNEDRTAVHQMDRAGEGEREDTGSRNKRDVWTVGSESFDLEFCSACQRSYGRTEYRALKRREVDDKTIVWCRCGETDKWLSHFATFPPALIVDCIRAGSPARCCAECGAPEVTCCCGAELVPGRVLDPFGGAGTTGMVANREHRDAILLELNPHYAEMTRQRLVRDGGMLVRVEVS